jgi:hypothetical protein
MSKASKRFNYFLEDFNLFEYELTGRKYTWYNGRQYALLDRFISSMAWDSHYSTGLLKDLPKFDSDHCPCYKRMVLTFLPPNCLDLKRNGF